MSALVFLDEFAAVSNMTRRYAWGPKNQRVVSKVPHGHWKVLSTVAAMGTGGMLCSSTFDAPINGELFGCFLEQVLVPALMARGPGQVVVMDNLQAHKSQRVAELLAQAEARVLYLPPYSPDLNPIEMAISKIKWWLRKRGARDLLRLDYAIGEAMGLITPSDATGFFTKCGYNATCD